MKNGINIGIYIYIFILFFHIFIYRLVSTWLHHTLYKKEIIRYRAQPGIYEDRPTPHHRHVGIWTVLIGPA